MTPKKTSIFRGFGAQKTILSYSFDRIVMIMAALCNREAIIFLPSNFFLSSSIFLFFYSSPNLSGRRLDVYHTSTHGVALVRI